MKCNKCGSTNVDARTCNECGTFFLGPEVIQSRKVMEQKGLPIPERNLVEDEIQKYRVLPQLEDCSLEELGNLLTAYAGLVAYATVVVAEADIEYHSMQREENGCYKSAVADQMSKGCSATEAKARAASSEIFNKYQAATAIREATFKLAQAVLGGYHQQYKAVSRELSRRGVEAEVSGGRRP